jgi:hypothetical protein
MMAIFRSVDRAYVLCMHCEEFNRTKLQNWPSEAVQKVVLWSGLRSDAKYCGNGKCKIDGFTTEDNHYAKASFAHNGMVAHAAARNYKQILVLEEDFCFNTNTQSWLGNEAAAFEHFLTNSFDGYLRLAFYGYLDDWLRKSGGREACACKLNQSHVCQIKKHCDLRGSEGYVLHQNLFPLFHPKHMDTDTEGNPTMSTMWIDMWPRAGEWAPSAASVDSGLDSYLA